MENRQISKKTKVAVIACAVLELEFEHYSKGLDHVVRFERLPQGLHNEPDRLRRELQVAVDQVEEDSNIEAIVLGYGLCSRGTEGVVTKRAQMVIPRAHDCITLLLGSKERYSEYVAAHPGTYWYSPGWNKHHVPPGEQRFNLLKEKYTEQYGDENAEYLMETEQNWFSTYERATYVDIGVGATDEDLAYTRSCADWLKWKFDRQHGAPDLIQALLNCEWDDERFLVLQPGESFKMTADARVIERVLA